ncbi:MAG: hypothetical protein K1000chlam3_01652 [Chlamydiae bacterium]|nr:hypothetical protein [Chlamydiota bacterium]
MTDLLVPTLLSPKGETRNYDEPCSWQRIVYPTISSAACISALVLKILDPHGYGTNPFWGTVLTFAAGATFQNGIQTALPRKFANQEKSFVGDYTTAIFLITTQVYANTNFSPLVKEIMLSSLVGLGGAATAAMIHTLFTRTLIEGRDAEPLFATLETDEDTDQMKGVFFTTSQRRMIWAAFEGIVGACAIIAGKVNHLSLLGDFGVILLGDGVGQLGSELWHRRIAKVHEKNPMEGVFYQKVAKIFLSLAHILPVPFIILAGSLNFQGSSDLFYGLSGLSTGIKRHMERVRFFVSPSSQLTELEYTKSPLNRIEKIFRVFKWGIAGLTAAYLACGIAGFDFETDMIDQFSNINAIDLSAFGLFLFGSYAVCEIAKKAFNKIQNHPIKNEFYFYTNYSLGAPIVALYLLDKMKIGDESLIHYKMLADVLSAVAYASLAIAIGQVASVRDEYRHPRIFSALPAALIGKFITRKFLGEV